MTDERIKITKFCYDSVPSYTIVVETKYKVLIEIDTLDNRWFRVNVSATGPMTIDEAELIASALSIAIDLAKKETKEE